MNCFNNLPSEVSIRIWSYLPEEQQSYIIPYVCKAWHNISLSQEKVMTTQTIKEYVNNNLKSEEDYFSKKYKHLPYIYTQVQINRISSFLQQPFMTSLKSINIFNQTRITDHPKILIHKKTNLQISTSHSECKFETNNFNVIWNPKSSKFYLGKEEEGKWGDFRSKHRVIIEENVYRPDPRLDPKFNDFSLRKFRISGLSKIVMISRGTVEKGGAFSWEPVIYPKPCPDELKGFWNALEIKINTYIQRLIKYNLSNLSSFLNIKDFEDRKFFCDERGVITEKESPFSFQLKLHTFTIQTTTLELLSWKADNLSDTEPLKAILRQVVISETTNKIAEKLGIQLETNNQD